MTADRKRIEKGQSSAEFDADYCIRLIPASASSPHWRGFALGKGAGRGILKPEVELRYQHINPPCDSLAQPVVERRGRKGAESLEIKQL